MLRSRTQKLLRRRINSVLSETCTIRRVVKSLDEYGSPIETAPVDTSSACFLTGLRRTSANLISGADVGRVFYELHLPYDADIEDTDVILLDGQEYHIEQVIARQSVNVMKQVIVVKVGE